MRILFSILTFPTIYFILTCPFLIILSIGSISFSMLRLFRRIFSLGCEWTRYSIISFYFLNIIQRKGIKSFNYEDKKLWFPSRNQCFTQPVFLQTRKWFWRGGKAKRKKESEWKRETFTALLSRKINMQYFSLNSRLWSRSNRFWCWYIFKLLPTLGGIQKMQQCFHVNCSVSIAPWENEAFPAIKILLTELWSYFSTRPTWDHKLGFFFFIFVVVIATNDY